MPHGQHARALWLLAALVEDRTTDAQRELLGRAPLGEDATDDLPPQNPT